jgi:hypothetical protein
MEETRAGGGERQSEEEDGVMGLDGGVEWNDQSVMMMVVVVGW